MRMDYRISQIVRLRFRGLRADCMKLLSSANHRADVVNPSRESDTSATKIYDLPTNVGTMTASTDSEPESAGTWSIPLQGNADDSLVMQESRGRRDELKNSMLSGVQARERGAVWFVETEE